MFCPVGVSPLNHGMHGTLKDLLRGKLHKCKERGPFLQITTFSGNALWLPFVEVYSGKGVS